MTRLDSWKEIAAHFGRRVRTVQRWEREEGLPVHRLAHRRRGTVHAFAEELEAWRASRTVLPADERAARERSRVEAAAPRRSAWPRAARIGALVVAAVAIAVAPREATPPVPADEPDPVRMARYLLHRDTAEAAQRAVDLCATAARAGEAALAAGDATARAGAAAAHECLAQGILALRSFGREGATESLRRAGREAERALALDPRRAEAKTLATRVRFGADWDRAAAERGYREAIALDPGSAIAHQALAHLLSGAGRHDEAIAEIHLAQRAAPLSAAMNDDGCWFYFRARRYREALVEAERALTLEPQRPGALQCVADAEEALGDEVAARAGAVALLRALDDPAADAIAAAPAGRAPRLLAERLLARLERKRSELQIPPGAFAMEEARLGRREEAFASLERALAEHDSTLLVLRVHPAFDALRGDPRFDDLLRRAGI